MIDINSPTWQIIKKHAEARLASLQRKLETKGAEIAETENSRGAIAELRIILAMAKVE